MNYFNETGGYFELELSSKQERYPSLIALNSARNCLRYIIKSKNISTLHIPYYICKSIIDVIKEEKCKIKFYSIDANFFPAENFSKNDWILYINYFGINYRNVKKICSEYNNVIIDNSQSFFSPYLKGIDTFYSPRKFFGVPDGGYLYTDKKINKNFSRDISFERSLHLLKSIDLGRNAGYENFKKSEQYLNKKPIKEMSFLTKCIMQSVDYEKIISKRIENFNLVHSALSNMNELNIKLSKHDVPMTYPFFKKGINLKNELIKNKVYIPTYWPKIEQWSKKDSFEMNLQKYLVALPIDQRLDTAMLKNYLKIISSYIIKTDLFIRPLAIKDAKISWRWRNNKDIWEFTGSRPDRIITEKMEKKWIREVLQRKDEKRFAICIGNKKYIGNVQLTNIFRKRAQFHIFIGDKKYWGKGIATHVTRKILEYAFRELNLIQVYLFVNKNNLAAIKAYIKCGFIKSKGGSRENFKMIINNKHKND